MNYKYYKWEESPLEWTKVSGGNAKHTLVLADLQEPGTSLPLLRKILRSVNLDFDEDIHFLRLSPDTHAALLSDPQIASYNTILMFGTNPTHLGMQFRMPDSCYSISYEQLTCVLAPALEEMEKTVSHKKTLWGILKKVFPQAEA